jgi:hypothetical protein
VIQVLVFTDGRRECLGRALWTFRKQLLTQDDLDWLVVNDNPDPDFCDWIEDEFPWVAVSHTRKRLGFAGTIQRGWSMIHPEADYVFHLEDDFVPNGAVDLDAMIDVLDANPHLTQVVLKRQPWSPEERAAGGIVEMWPDEYVECGDEVDGQWSEHRLFWSTNPCVYRTAITEFGWPDAPDSERQFTERVLADAEDWRFAFWGSKLDPPAVTHIGEHRVGEGY